MFPGYTELLIIFAIVLIIFGGKKIPELMGGLGKGIKSFKKGLDAPDSDDSTSTNKRLEDSANETNNKPQE